MRIRTSADGNVTNPLEWGKAQPPITGSACHSTRAVPRAGTGGSGPGSQAGRPQVRDKVGAGAGRAEPQGRQSYKLLVLTYLSLPGLPEDLLFSYSFDSGS